MFTKDGSPLAEKQDAQSLHAWLVLSHFNGMQSRLYNRLLHIFNSPQNILASDPQQLQEAGLHKDLARDISKAGQGLIPEAMKCALDLCQSWLDSPEHHLLTCQSPDYPVLLSFIPDPPPLLYVKGKPESLHSPMIAMVGSRQPSAGGRRNARRFARELALNNLGVVSGLALGIDVESHRGAIEAGKSTVAALGTGIDKIYPQANKAMFEAVAENGALVSEFNIGTPPRPINFPQRNRIISGLSKGVLVVEAGIRSGSMITARFALEQGRDVFAIPGSIHNPLARGCHKLIAEGAKLAQCVEDIVEEKLLPVENFLAADDKPEPCLSEEVARVKNAIGFDWVSLDELVLETGFDVQSVSVALIELELKGLIQRENNGYALTPP
ncbi:MAG: DNA-protecting protein DprA [Gammaproteobacteria bacterium]|nr:DNA-protecting protein DprA [Gammaproteobacteria bacterium]